LCLELKWTQNSKSKTEINWLAIQILVFGCAWNLLLETKGICNSNSCLDVQPMEFDDLLSLNNINLRTYNKNSMCILECMNIMLR
jgi:hypothetical protein